MMNDDSCYGLQELQNIQNRKPSQHSSGYSSLENCVFSTDSQFLSYNLGNVIGKGNFSIVKKAEHMPTNLEVAIKIVEKTKLTAHDLGRISREVSILKRLRHSNITKMYQVVETSTQLFIVMEYVPNGELFEFVSKFGKINEPDACKKFSQLLDAVDYCHKQGVVHRDLKMENILLDVDHNVKLADFGFGNFYSRDSHLTTFCGSPPYAAPEIFQGIPYHGTKSDIWSLGVILYCMVVGGMPFEQDCLPALRHQVVLGVFRVPYWVSLNCDNLIRSMLRVQPERRVSIAQIRQHVWMRTNSTVKPISNYLPDATNDSTFMIPDTSPNLISNTLSTTPFPWNNDALKIMDRLGHPKQYIAELLQRQVYDHVMADYLLLCDYLSMNITQEQSQISSGINGGGMPANNSLSINGHSSDHLTDNFKTLSIAESQKNSMWHHRSQHALPRDFLIDLSSKSSCNTNTPATIPNMSYSGNSTFTQNTCINPHTSTPREITPLPNGTENSCLSAQRRMSFAGASLYAPHLAHNQSTVQNFHPIINNSNFNKSMQKNIHNHYQYNQQVHYQSIGQPQHNQQYSHSNHNHHQSTANNCLIRHCQQSDLLSPTANNNQGNAMLSFYAFNAQNHHQHHQQPFVQSHIPSLNSFLPIRVPLTPQSETTQPHRFSLQSSIQRPFLAVGRRQSDCVATVGRLHSNNTISGCAPSDSYSCKSNANSNLTRRNIDYNVQSCKGKLAGYMRIPTTSDYSTHYNPNNLSHLHRVDGLWEINSCLDRNNGLRNPEIPIRDQMPEDYLSGSTAGVDHFQSSFQPTVRYEKNLPISRIINNLSINNHNDSTLDPQDRLSTLISMDSQRPVSQQVYNSSNSFSSSHSSDSPVHNLNTCINRQFRPNSDF